MIEKMIELFGNSFTVSEVPLGEKSVQKVSPMTFKLRQFTVEGVGNLSVMEGSALFGLMKMYTLILTPNRVDAPIFSYDRIFAMGNDTLITEFYDTRLNKTAEATESALSKLQGLQSMLSAYPVHDLGAHWYDSIKHPASVSYRGKKCSQAFDAYVEEAAKGFIELLKNAPAADVSEKTVSNGAYVNGLFEHGGPSTDAFIKKIGKDATKELFETVIFGTKN